MVLQRVLKGKAKYLIEPQENPYRALTHYHEEGKKETSWSCSSTHYYALQGWNEGGKVTAKEVREYIRSPEGKQLLSELSLYAN